MAYLPLNNYNYDSGYRRIQSGPNHEQFIVLTSGSSAYGADNGIVVAGSPLSGTIAAGAWDYDDNWRYVPSTLPTQSGSLDPTPYNVSGALDTYDGTRIATRTSVAGAQAASAIGSDFGVVQPRGGALQPGAGVTRPEKYMYFGGAAPDNQNYSPYNTPDANTAAEGKTGGPITHRTYENTLITNVLGSQGTSDRSQWRYHQPVYCKTFTETVRSDSPGLMSTPLRYVYRGSATQYNYLYGSLFGGSANASSPIGASFGPGNPGGFEQLPYDDQTGGCGIPVGCPAKSGVTTITYTGDIFEAIIPCVYSYIKWYNTASSESVGEGETYTVQSSDIGYKIYFIVTYPNNSTDSSDPDCYNLVQLRPVSLNQDFFAQYTTSTSSSTVPQPYTTYFENDGTAYCLYKTGSGYIYPIITKISSDRQSVLWSTMYRIIDGYNEASNNSSTSYSLCADDNYLYLFMSRLNTVDYRKTNLHLLTINKSNGEVISNDVATFTNTTTTPISAIRANSDTISALTDGSENFWLLFQAPIDVTEGRVVLHATKTDAGLIINWCYLLPVTDRRGPTVIFRTRSAGNSLEFKYGKLKIGPYTSGGSTTTYDGVDLTLIEPYSGVFDLRKEPLIIDNITNRNSLDSTIDEDGNIYHIYVDTTSYTIQTKFYIIKRDSNDITIWAKNYDAITSGAIVSGPSMQLDGSDLLVCIEKLFGATTPLHYVYLFRIDTSTGDLKRNVRIEPPKLTNHGWDQLFSDPTIIEWKTEGEFIIQDAAGYKLGVNASGIPSPFYSGGSVDSLSSTTPSGYWRFRDLTTAGVIDATVVSGAGAISPIYPYTDYGTIDSYRSDPVYVATSGALSTVQYRFISKLA